jgi:hypothetical protein
MLWVINEQRGAAVPSGMPSLSRNDSAFVMQVGSSIGDAQRLVASTNPAVRMKSKDRKGAAGLARLNLLPTRCADQRSRIEDNRSCIGVRDGNWLHVDKCRFSSSITDQI